MEKFLKPYDKEYMRMAMLKHEETFKEQVYELHRLYQVQKLLMSNNGRNNQELWSAKNGFSFNKQNNHNHNAQQQNSLAKLDLERPPEEYVAESNIGDRGGIDQVIDESEIELTLGPTTYNRRKKLETPLNSDSGPSFSSSSTGSTSINRKSSLTHQKTNLRREELDGHEPGMVQVPDTTLGSKSSADHEEELRQERLKQPPWLFQVLSLNMT